MTVTREKKTTQLLRGEQIYQSKAMRGLGRMEELEKKTERERRPYREGVGLCIERARLYTQASRQAEGEPMVLRRAKCLSAVLDKMTIYILPHERIVGNSASKPDSIITYPELWWRWLDKAIENEYKILLPDETERKELHEIHKYWRNQAVHGMERSLLSEQVLPYWYYTNHGVISWIHGGRTGVPNYEKVFKLGLNGIIDEAKLRLKAIDADPVTYLNAREYLEQKRFLQAAIISLEAGVRFGKRFAQKAEAMAKVETHAGRKKELEEIAEICNRVPGEPPRTLHEALQCYWFITLITRILDLQTPGLGDRFDQNMYPFYRKDTEEKRITRGQAQELVEHVWLKMNEEGQLVPPAQGAGGFTLMTARVLDIGGQTAEGNDATNDMSYIVLDACKSIRLAQPAVAVRLHRNSPEEFLLAVIDVHQAGAAGLISLFNDEMMVPYLMGFGIPVQDARSYTTEGCMRWIIPGKAMGMRALGGYFCLLKCLEYALNQGMDKFSGKRWGCATPDPHTFESIDDVIRAYLDQVRFFFEKHVAIYNMVDVLDEEYLPQPFLSALMDGCIEKGRDCRKYKYFPNTIIQPNGQINVVNSLAAMKKLVFAEKRVSMAELLDALKNNWEGKEDLRRMFITQAPKFGNDDDYVDLLARDVALKTTQVFRSFKNIWGGSFLEDGTGGSTYFAYSGLTGATPDGRKDRDLFNDGTISPVIGTDKKGPTAVLRSVAKIDHVRTFTQLLNQKFLPEFFRGENRAKFVSYLRTWVGLGIHHVQFNVMDADTLRDAQLHPERYGDLVVRVAGFSAYFVDLEKELQEQIIDRTELTL